VLAVVIYSLSVSLSIIFPNLFHWEIY